MPKKILLSLAITAGALLQTAQATVLTFTPQAQTVTQGDTFNFDAVVTGLTSASEIVSAFDVSVDFNNSLLQFVAGTDGTALGDPNDFSQTLSYSGPPAATGGTISWDLTSFLGDATLSASQGDSVSLGTLTFKALNQGIGDFSYSYHDLTGTGGNQLPLETIDTGSVNIVANTSTVPEPSTLFLLGIGTLGLLVRARNKRSQ